ncbi:TlpA disulfide reductase family protein [Flavobacterium urocaniciphilum]|uniref:Peroxiredoxin n=1 Tax=Flavobacterium urocaniciphilum TaxID=1299341 RepID=A0A1H9CVJ4_9FLAO|nr:TlpA disulfide reductase family protein [Flavobacterium urocaniciphilum]SEQ05205.1 Peroxiredoxin [Flavobacterium urocaniciphilum]
MKKILITLIAATFLVSCKKEDYTISGDIKNHKGADYVYIEIQNGDKPKVIDSVKIKDGKFEFKGKADSLDIAFIKIPAIQCIFPFVLENGSIDIKINKDSIFAPKISGTENNDDLQKFNNDIIKLNKEMNDFAMKNQSAYNEATAKNDQVTIEKLTTEIKKIRQNLIDFTPNYIKNNKNFIALIVLENFAIRGNMPANEAKTHYNKFSEELKNTKSGIRINKVLNPNTGKKKVNKAADFSAKTPDGKLVSLKESLGKVTIIDFWASWCPPCRAENPNIVALYNEFHAKGLNIIGVSLDDNIDSWKKAIEKDKLTWTHVSNLKKWEDPIAKMYQVEEIPATFLLDAQGIIIAKNLHGDELKAKIAELLK